MKIGIVCYPTYGGSGIVATELGMEMAKKGHQVHFISYSLPARLDVTTPNITFHQVHIQEYELFHYQPYSLALSTLIVEIVERQGAIRELKDKLDFCQSLEVEGEDDVRKDPSAMIDYFKENKEIYSKNIVNLLRFLPIFTLIIT